MRRKPENKKIHLDVTAAVVWEKGKILITRRPSGTHMGGYWEFPGGKREDGETLEQCLKRELWEELGIRVEISKPIVSVHHEYEDRTVTLHAFSCFVVEGEAVAKESQEICWVILKKLPTYRFPPPDEEIIRRIIDRECDEAIERRR
ncbi:MAG: 8-oxo-dGTP diphosphatase MutT [Deltaproteobacteria bacterium]|nr:8-oxo-dGTP diphosphatase MutT [Deltaproteobacteria bacterium]MBW1928962.1 8-oxo-dGTP diphosphatase MutT [Deltaproteobacteria bacterium]MBW2024505.1 8-oxo-dGTP diphosphatase MutT [Deltaproteobacteria bacterium]MBW2125144.1 8-oxo-dGTP diphosphatase MutT [Deltaproteobacteria bacterium]